MRIFSAVMRFAPVIALRALAPVMLIEPPSELLTLFRILESATPALVFRAVMKAG